MQVYLIERIGNKNSPLQEADLSAIPVHGDKVILDIEGTETIFKVIDVHYSDKSRTELIVTRLSSFIDYNNDPGLLRSE